VRRFPVGQYGRQTLQFFPAPFRAPLRAFAALVFPWKDADHVVLADIDGRGWCIPSGRVEPDETSAEAARREALEEAGAVLGTIDYLGCYHITERREVRWADVYVSDVLDLVEIGIPEESHGMRLATMEELPTIYHLWNELTERVFLHSREVLARRK
jgi:8-oxo-dGTP diphosphatase